MNESKTDHFIFERQAQRMEGRYTWSFARNMVVSRGAAAMSG